MQNSQAGNFHSEFVFGAIFICFSFLSTVLSEETMNYFFKGAGDICYNSLLMGL